LLTLGEMMRFVMSGQPVEDFLAYVRRRQSLMGRIGVAIIVVGIVAITAAHGVADLDIFMGAVVIVGVCLVVAAGAGRRLLREATAALAGPSRSLELQTYPYRAGWRSIGNDRVLATLDEPGSGARTPLVEFKATWFTPGIGEAPRGEARVFGGTRQGQAVLAVSDRGGVMGRVRRIHAT